MAFGEFFTLVLVPYNHTLAVEPTGVVHYVQKHDGIVGAYCDVTIPVELVGRDEKLPVTCVRCRGIYG